MALTLILLIDQYKKNGNFTVNTFVLKMSSQERLRIILNHLKPSVKRVSTKTYKYTLDNPLLSQEQRDFYEENGFLVVRKLIDDEILDMCKQRFKDLCNKKAPKGEMTMMSEVSLLNSTLPTEHRYYKVQDIIWDEVFEKYIFYDKLLNYIECFTGPDIYAIQSMVINKPPDVGNLTTRHPMHQDLLYFPFSNYDRVVASWTAIEDEITVENGCIFVVPGTHKAALQPHSYPEYKVNKAFLEIQGFDRVNPTSLPMQKGDTVFFHPLLFHGSWPNLSNGFRKCITVHYSSSYCGYTDTRGTPQQVVAEEFVDMYKKKYGFRGNFSFLDVHRMKRRLVRGHPGTLWKSDVPT